MKLISKLLIPTVAYLTLASNLQASHHFQSGLAQKYPAFNVGDLFVFKSKNRDKTTFILTTNPSTPGKGGKSADLSPKTAFADNGLYNIHIAQNTKDYSGSTYTFHFKGKEIRMGKINGANEEGGKRQK